MTPAGSRLKEVTAAWKLREVSNICGGWNIAPLDLEPGFGFRYAFHR
jgi:hypothetical protein